MLAPGFPRRHVYVTVEFGGPMPAEFLDTNEALRQLSLYLDPAALRASLLAGDRGRQWETECGRQFRRLWAALKTLELNHSDEEVHRLNVRALDLLSEVWDVPALVIERGLRPETGASLLSNLTRLQTGVIKIRRRLREMGSAALEKSLQDSLDDLAFPIAHLATHVNALAALYDILMVRPALRVIEHWLYGAPAPAERDEESVEAD
jgi:hypothetical protein